VKIDKDRLKETMKLIAKYYEDGRVIKNSESNGFLDILSGKEDIEDDADATIIVDECIKEFLIVDLKMCGCGSPERTQEVIKLVLEAHSIKDYKCRMEALSNICDVDINKNANYDGLIQFVLYILDSHGILEHGSSIGGAWLTEKGKALLELLQMSDKINE